MAEHPAVAYLRDAHERAEELARAAAHETQPEWSDGGKYSDAVITVPRGETVVIGPYEYLADPIREHIAANDPAAVLRRVKAEREILADHEAYQDLAGPWRCNRCASHEAYGNGVAIQEAFPCPTVRLLAAGWGWTA